MNTRIADKSLSPESIAGHTDAFSNLGSRTQRDVNARTRSNDDRERSDDDSAAGLAAKTARPSAEDARHFEAAMRSEEQRSEAGDSSSEQEPDTKEQDATQEEAAGDLSFAALFAGRFDGGTVAPSAKAEAAQAAESPQRAESLAERLAERILVSESSEVGQEVRIQPSRDILPDTEICLVRGADGLLSAVIRTDNPSSFQTLAAAQHELRTRLEASEGQTVKVELRSSADDDNDPRRRSRGLDLDPQA